MSELTERQQVPQAVLDAINTRYGGRLENGKRLYPELLEANWGTGSLDRLKEAVSGMKANPAWGDRGAPVTCELGAKVFLNVLYRFDEFEGLCDAKGNLTPSFHISENRTHYAIAEGMQIFVGLLIELGLVERWGELPFEDYFGYGKNSGSCTLGHRYRCIDREELLLRNPETRELVPQEGVLLLTRIRRRMSEEARAGLIHLFDFKLNLGIGKQVEWCQTAEQFIVHASERNLPEASPFFKKGSRS